MTIHTDNGSAALTIQHISDEEADTITSALAMLHGIVKGANYSVAREKEALGAFDQSNTDQHQAIAVRAIKALIVRSEAMKLERVRQFRAGVEKVCRTYIDLAQMEKEEFDAMSDSLRARLGLTTFPDMVSIPLGALVATFPDGMPQESMIKMLHDMGYKVGKGKDGAFTMRVPFVAA